VNVPTRPFGLTRRRSWQHAAQSPRPAGPGAAGTTARDPRRWLILAVTGVAQLMIILDLTVMNLALPSAQHALGFTNVDRQWVVTASALSFGSLLLFCGRLADLIGRKVTRGAARRGGGLGERQHRAAAWRLDGHRAAQHDRGRSRQHDRDARHADAKPRSREFTDLPPPVPGLGRNLTPPNPKTQELT
jgi:hypothetical protein